MPTRSDNLAIRLTNISKRYTIHHEKPTLVEKLVRRDETFWALRDINLTIKKGERVGIIGHNGSGKTTLLKIIAGITTPTTGTVETRGRIVSLIDLEAGFHPDLTGIQNIFLNGMLLGMKKDEIEHKLDAIIRFADIRQFIDVPLYTYSNGMKLRLGFSIAVHANPDILILDEGMSVGDKAFQEKTKKKLDEFFRKKITLLMVSHHASVLKNICRRFLILSGGSMKNDGGISLLSAIEP